VQADHLALTGLVDPIGDHQGAMLDPTTGPHLLDLGVQSQVRIGALQRPLPEGLDLLVQATTQPGYLILAHPGQPQGLHQPIDLAGRDAVT
jgi:hypothetical protein